MTITSNDRIAAMEIACRAERDALERAERAGNWVAAAINRQRVAVADSRLAVAKRLASS